MVRRLESFTPQNAIQPSVAQEKDPSLAPLPTSSVQKTKEPIHSFEQKKGFESSLPTSEKKGVSRNLSPEKNPITLAQAENLEILSSSIQAGQLLKKGSKGKEIFALQNLLNQLGAKPKLKVDGKAGSQTEQAIQFFQKSNQLKVDGIVGPDTLEALKGLPSQPVKTDSDNPSPKPTKTDSLNPSPVPKEVNPSPKPTKIEHNDFRISEGTPFAKEAANHLSNQEALAELQSLQKQGKAEFVFQKDGRVQVLFPVEGVDFQGSMRKTPDKKSYALDPRMAVATVRLAQWANSQGITKINHAGFVGNNREDRHGQGRAFDISGFEGTHPKTGNAFDYNIYRDWGKAPKQGEGFRLDPNTEKGKLFQEAYQFLTTQFRDTQSHQPSQIGDRSYILSPDHPNPKIAKGHANHFHIEVAPNPGEKETSHNHSHD